MKSNAMKSKLLVGLLLIPTLSVFAFNKDLNSNPVDPNLWLEEVEGDKALEWVKQTNLKTNQKLASTPLYQSLYQDALSALNNKDKLLTINQRGDWIYNHLKNADHPRGIYRRASLASFSSGAPSWQTVLDIDAMAKAEGVKWVFKGMNCLQPSYEKCLVNLSPGGTDANEMREFNSKTLKFVDAGFKLPSSKMSVSWMDENHLFVGTDFGMNSMTDSGYPRIQKIWQRGTDLADAKTVLEVGQKSVAASAYRLSSNGEHIDLLVDSLTFWTNDYSQLINGKKIHLNLPQSVEIKDTYDGQLVILLQEDWHFNGQEYLQGSVLLVEPSLLRGEKGTITQLIGVDRKSIVEEITVTSKGILAVMLEDVKSRVYSYQKKNGQWNSTLIDLPKTGSITIETTNETTGEFFVRYEDFVTPPTLYAVDTNLKATIAMQQSATFDGSKFKVEQFFAKSVDGTDVPYFVVMDKNTQMNGKNPTHIFAYGGFRNSVKPSYSGSYEDLNGAYGKMWLERGGIYVIANIRGGGEYGPAWHAAALLENRTKAYEDFEAVATNLFERKITSAKHLGIEGRSNGGLLVGATMTRRPDLYGAVVCGVPLLDMQRYHTLLAGASWMAEFGNPDTDDWSFIKEYSPYQNLKKDQKYPSVLFYTSTKDDRVHPGHARKMAAQMIAMGQDVDYYENMEGGHAGSSTTEQLAKRIALSFTHLWMHLK